MRAEPLRALGWDLLYYGRDIPRDYDVIWMVKGPRRWDPSIRSRAGRLIFDPLDFWSAGQCPNLNPFSEWWKVWQAYQFETIVGTSPAACETMRTALSDSLVQFIPHHCDPEIWPKWRDDRGHIAYGGLPHFIDSGRDALEAACRHIGRRLELRCDDDAQWALHGAALALCVRFPPYAECPVCRYLKPQVKLENAAAAGLPLVYNGAPCETSLRPGHPNIGNMFNARSIANVLDLALSSEPARNPFTLDMYLEAVRDCAARELVSEAPGVEDCHSGTSTDAEAAC